MKPPNPVVAIASAKRMTKRSDLLHFREKMVAAGSLQVVEAVDQRLDQLAAQDLHRSIGTRPSNLSVAQRVMEAVRVLEEVRAYKNDGKRRPATRTRRMIAARGEIGAVRQTVMTHTTSSGLEELAAHGRLDCAFEQIILDFPEAFDEAAVAKAQANLGRFQVGS
jgi:hypothetical protein